MKFKFCPNCGTKLVEKNIGDEGKIPYCEKCKIPVFEMFSTCIIVLIVNENGEAALLKQNYISNKYYNLVSGYMKPGESAEETARREVQEELGLTVSMLQIIDTYWFGKKDMLMIGFIGNTTENEFVLSEEVDSAQWISAEEAITMVHPKGSVSYALLEKFLKEKAVKRWGMDEGTAS